MAMKHDDMVPEELRGRLSVTLSLDGVESPDLAGYAAGYIAQILRLMLSSNERAAVAWNQSMTLFVTDADSGDPSMGPATTVATVLTKSKVVEDAILKTMKRVC